MAKLSSTERLDRAIAASGLQQRVVLRHHAFLLQPDVPPEGTDIATYIRTRYGREPDESHVEAMARESGIALDMTKQTRFYQTLYAHTLLREAGRRGTQ